MALAGISNVQPLPQTCLSFASQIVPDLLGRHYMDKLFAKESIADMKGFIASLKEAFNELLKENNWMDSTTKANAIKKLNAITEHIAFPDYTLNDTQLIEYHKQVLILLYYYSWLMNRIVVLRAGLLREVSRKTNKLIIMVKQFLFVKWHNLESLQL